MKKFFIIGTDTEVGKTYITAGLLRLASKRGLKAMGLKPVATGGFMRDGKVYNQDALLLQHNSTIVIDYDLINPFSYLPAVSPHIATKDLSVGKIYQNLAPMLKKQAEIIFIEGVGGWYAPINDHETMAELVVKCNIPVILVIGIKLGCLNHAILTHQTILRAECKIKGWVANCIDPAMQAIDDNIGSLQKMLSSPCLGVVPYLAKPEAVLAASSFFEYQA